MFTASIPLTDGLHTNCAPWTQSPNKLAPSQKSRLQAASYTPLAASGQNPRYGTHHGEVCRGRLALWALALAGAPFSREIAGFGDRWFTLTYAPICKPHAGLAPAPLRESGAHLPVADRAAAVRHIYPAYTPRRLPAAGLWLKQGGRMEFSAPIPCYHFTPVFCEKGANFSKFSQFFGQVHNKFASYPLHSALAGREIDVAKSYSIKKRLLDNLSLCIVLHSS